MHNLTQRIKQHPIFSIVVFLIFIALVLSAPGDGLKRSSPFSSDAKNVQSNYVTDRDYCRAFAESSVTSDDKNKRDKLVAIYGRCIKEKEWEGYGFYNLGWADGCDTGLHASRPALFMPALTRPFTKRAEMGTSDPYKQGWNEGYTSCRFYQSSWLATLAFVLVILTLVLTRCRCRSN